MSQNISDLCKCWQFYLQWLGCIRQLSLCSQLTPGLPVVWALQHCCFSRVTHTTTGCLKCRCSGHLTLFITERVIFYWTCESWTVITCWTCYQIILHGCGYGSKVFPIRFGGSYHACPLHSYLGLTQRSSADLPPLRPGLAHYCIFQTMYNWWSVHSIG